MSTPLQHTGGRRVGLDTVTNLVLVVAAVAVLGLHGYRMVMASPALPPAPYEAGDIVPLFSAAPASAQDRLVLFLSSSCGFCTQSAPFYKTLVSQLAKTKAAQLTVVTFEEVSSMERYLAQMAIDIDDVRQIERSATALTGTPTLLLMDGKGVVKQVWVGLLQDAQQAAVLKQL